MGRQSPLFQEKPEQRLNVTGLQGNRNAIKAALGAGHPLIMGSHNWTIAEVKQAIAELKNSRVSKVRAAGIKVLEAILFGGASS